MKELFAKYARGPDFAAWHSNYGSSSVSSSVEVFDTHKQEMLSFTAPHGEVFTPFVHHGGETVTAPNRTVRWPMPHCNHKPGHGWASTTVHCTRIRRPRTGRTGPDIENPQEDRFPECTTLDYSTCTVSISAENGYCHPTLACSTVTTQRIFHQQEGQDLCRYVQ